MFMNVCPPLYEAWKKEENIAEKRAGPKEPVFLSGRRVHLWEA